MENQTLPHQLDGNLDMEIRQVKSLISLCDNSGVVSPVSSDEVDTFVAVYDRDPSELALVSLRTRLKAMHRGLHEVLYAPKG